MGVAASKKVEKLIRLGRRWGKKKKRSRQKKTGAGGGEKTKVRDREKKMVVWKRVGARVALRKKT